MIIKWYFWGCTMQEVAFHLAEAKSVVLYSLGEVMTLS